MSEASELLETLADIVEPPPPEGVPAALVAANVGLAALVVALLVHRRWSRRRAWLADSLARLRAVDHDDPAAALLALASLLRRVVRYRRGDADDRLQGEAWLARLDAEFGGDWFVRGEGRVFGEALYAPEAARRVDTRALARTLARRLRKLPRVRHRERARSAGTVAP